MIEAFPLQWPLGYPRSYRKRDSQFKCTVAMARDGILHEVVLMKGINVIISTNIQVKKDGLLYASGKPVDSDHGVAVYFSWKNDQVVLACDHYNSVRENLRAIELSLQAMRGLDRWGCSDILNRTFAGFKALPEPPDANVQTCWDILGINPDSTLEEIHARYKKLAKTTHPDAPDGNHEEFIKLTKACSEALDNKRL